jgi:uncharacterized protein YuzE
MKIAYYPETDSLYIDLGNRPSVDTEEISEGINLDYDEEGIVVGIDIDSASKKLDLKTVVLSNFPQETELSRG